jgi:hypothetical protein
MCSVALRCSYSSVSYQVWAAISDILSAITGDVQKCICFRATKHSYKQTFQQTNITRKKNKNTGHSEGHRKEALKYVNWI